MSLDELNQKLKAQNLIGYWTIPDTSAGFREPEANFRRFSGTGRKFAQPQAKGLVFRSRFFGFASECHLSLRTAL